MSRIYREGVLVKEVYRPGCELPGCEMPATHWIQLESVDGFALCAGRYCEPHAIRRADAIRANLSDRPEVPF